MPFINREVIEFIVDYPSEKMIIVPFADGFIQELCGIYKKGCLDHIERLISNSKEEESRDNEQKKRKCKVHQLVNSLDGTMINIETEFPNYQPGTFQNMNNPEEYERMKNSLSSQSLLSQG